MRAYGRKLACTDIVYVHEIDEGEAMSTTQERTTTITVRMPESMKDQLEELARVTGRQRTYLALEAIRKYLEVEAWQIARIQEAIGRADSGEFATDEQVAAVRARFRDMGQT